MRVSHSHQVHRLANNGDVAGGQLAVFQGASEAPDIRANTGRASNAEKQPTGPGPEGCVENGPAAALLVGYVPHHFVPAGENQYRSVKWCGMRPPRALPTAHFERNDVTIICETVH